MIETAEAATRCLKAFNGIVASIGKIGTSGGGSNGPSITEQQTGTGWLPGSAGNVNSTMTPGKADLAPFVHKILADSKNTFFRDTLLVGAGTIIGIAAVAVTGYATYKAVEASAEAIRVWHAQRAYTPRHVYPALHEKRPAVAMNLATFFDGFPHVPQYEAKKPWLVSRLAKKAISAARRATDSHSEPIAAR